MSKTPMREIKFRAWNGIEMVYDVIVGRFGAFYVNPYNNGIDEKDSACLTPFNTKYPESIPIMQFTGLIDMNGKDIFEGDILKLPNGSFVDVRFESGCFEILNEPLSYDFDSEIPIKCYPSHYAEVIGNIYENPELLNHP